MAPTRTPTRRKSRGALLSSPASTSKSKEPASAAARSSIRSTRRKTDATGLDGALDAENETQLDEDPVEAETPSRRGRGAKGRNVSAATTPRVTNGDAQASTTPASRKRKAAKISRAEATQEKEQEVEVEMEDSIVVDPDLSTRSSGRARKRTAKADDTEVPQKPARSTRGTPKATPKSATKSTAKSTPKTTEKATPNGTPKSAPKSAAEGSTKTTTPKPSTKASAKKSTAKGQRTEPAPVVEDEPIQDEPAPEATQEPDPAAEQLQQEAAVEQPEAIDTPNTTPRKRGRPKGSKNKKTLAKMLEAPPFEDISITPNSKARKLAQEALAAQAVLDAAIDAEARALEEKAKLLEQGVDPLQDEETTMKTPLEQTTNDEPQPALDALKQLLKKPVHGNAYTALREEIILRMSGKRLTPLVGVETEYRQVHSLLQQTVAAGEGNSLLVIGNRGAGKTTLVETALEEVYFAHPGEFHTIRLNGFVHTDDKVALREIWRQLGREMQLSDAEHPVRGNYADTLASLLAVLSHPAEFTGDVATQQTSKAVVFILDEFDLFATHPRQTLLYNLFDIAQSRKAPIAVLGLTTKIDVIESLEKRVKSRFSHRFVHLPSARSYATFLSVIQSALHADVAPEFAPPPSAPVVFALSRTIASEVTLQKAWSAHVTATLSSEPLNSELRRVYAHSKSIPQVLTGFLPGVIGSSAGNPPSASSLLSGLVGLRGPDSKLSILASLSDAQLALLVAAARLDVILATDAVNFLLAADEYAKLAHRAKVVSAPGMGGIGGGMGPGTLRTWGRDVLLASWEALAQKGLLVPVLGGDISRSGASAAVAADAGKRGKLWRVDVSLEELGRWFAQALSNGGMGSGIVLRELERWCRNI